MKTVHDIARRTVTRLQAPAFRLAPVIRIGGHEYTPDQLARLDAARQWGSGTAQLIQQFLTCYQRQRHKQPPRSVWVTRDPHEQYPDDLEVIGADGWQVYWLLYPDDR